MREDDDHRDSGLDGDELWSAIEPESSRRMLLAAVEAFADRGFHATTTRDIALRAGLSPAALYVHYPSKAALLAQISRVGHETALALVEQAVTDAAAGDPDDPVAALRLVVERFVGWHARHHRIGRVVQYELAALPEQDRLAAVALRRRIETTVEALVRDGVRRGVMQVDRPRPVARAVLSLGIDVVRWYDAGGRESPEELGRLYADLAVRMVGVPPSAP